MIWKTVICGIRENEASRKRAFGPARTLLRFFASIFLGVVLVLAAGSLPALADAPLFQAAVNYGVDGLTSSAAVGDFNGDGNPDLAVTVNTLYGKVSVFLDNGDGTLQTAVGYEVGGYAVPGGVAVGDFNRDGHPDLAVTKYDNVNCYFSVLLNNGDGTFGNAADYAIDGAYPSKVTVGDFNGDGYPDLATANKDSSTTPSTYYVYVLLNQGDGNGTFQPAVSYGVGSEPRNVAVGDFDGDGNPDLAVANSGENNVSVLLGNGNGTFQTAVNYGVGTGPYSVAVGDFNGDGYPDLATTTSSYNVSVLLNQGDGTFQAAVNHGVGGVPNHVVVGDFNGDEKPDLAMAVTHNVTILLGNGDGTFQAAENYGVGGSPSSVAVGDFKGDGMLDLATTNGASSNVSILLNNGFVTRVDLPGPIPDLTAGGSVFDLNSLPLTAFSPWGEVVERTRTVPWTVHWTVQGTTGSLLDGHFLMPVSSGSGDTVTATIENGTSDPVSFNVLPAVNNADLSDLAVSPGSISGFDPDTVAYSVYNSGSPDSLSVTATVYDFRSSLTIGGQAATSGVAKTVSLNNGANLVPVVVTAADGQTQKAYVLSVNGTVSDADLGSLSVSIGSLSFDPATTAYDLGSVASSESSLDITAGPHDPKAMVLVNGSPLPPGGGSKNVSLAYGANSIEVTVVAQDATIKTYTIGVTRGQPTGTGKYTITPAGDPDYSTGATTQGIATMTVNSGVTGFKYFTVNVAVAQSHSGDEVVIFRQVRNGTQVAIVATRADFDRENSAVGSFNVSPGDVIEAYIVDDLSNNAGFNPSLLQ